MLATWTIRDLAAVAVAGAVGSVARYLVSGLATSVVGPAWPAGTLAVNVLGSLAMGLLMQLGLDADVLPRELRLALTVGFLGAFTTFSAFSYETVRALESGAWTTAATSVAANLALCLAATWAGLALGRLWVSG